MKQLFKKFGPLWLSAKTWTIVGGAAAIFSLLLSAMFFYSGAALTKRTLISGLALQAHEDVYNFLAQVNEHYSGNRDSEGRFLVKPGDDIAPEIRIALVQAEGAIARAKIIDDADISACLDAMYYLMGSLVEAPMFQGIDSALRSTSWSWTAFPTWWGAILKANR
ncbi:hypothetical protein HEP89_19820 [Labrenzia sp. 5N]|uniref:hypothetical protein n=1 Tax=Labrenzia sp. 5N TaxID=2723402 RepID=UPI0014474F6D|nr:hypothetical protein [Labrenzia sp. 5N]NKX66379.1 hypothetical protein [Labrenzia sp. 5N]